jgi:hypothetical protein
MKALTQLEQLNQRRLAVIQNTFMLMPLIMSAPCFFVFKQHLLGYVLLGATLLYSAAYNRKLFRDAVLLAFSLIIMSLVPINTDISAQHMIEMGLAMGLIVTVPYLVSRYIYKDHAIRFPWHFRERWSWQKWAYIGLVAVVGYLLLPYYMIETKAYLNWPDADTAGEILRLFAGTNALGIWDELFFICTAFVLLRRHVPFWIANLFQAVLFSSFLYELGFTSWGLPMTFLFALIQAYIFRMTHSLFYIVCVHLLFDLFLFLVLIHAHNRDILDIFLV